MKKARWLLEHFTLDELNRLKGELKDVLAQCDEGAVPLLKELLEKIQIDSHSRYLYREERAWRCSVKKEQTS